MESQLSILITERPVPIAEGFTYSTAFNSKKAIASPENKAISSLLSLTMKSPPTSPYRTPKRLHLVRTPTAPKKPRTRSRIAAIQDEDKIMEDWFP